MAAEVQTARGDAPAADDALTLAMRHAATRAVQLTGGGFALVFVSVPGTQRPQLRAAAGFSDADEARATAAALTAPMADAMADARPWRGPAPAGVSRRGAAGIWIGPLRFGERVLGSMAVGAPQGFPEGVVATLADLGDGLAVRLDHAALSDRLRTLQEEQAGDENDGPDGDELLKLSEQLFAQDIELLRNNERLGKVEKLKNDFIEKMSRELRTPLNSIIESIISVLAGENESLSEGGKLALRNALDDGTSFLRTLQNILDLWRIKQGELPVEAQEVNFREVVEEAIFSVQDTLGTKPVEIVRNIQEPLPNVGTDLAKLNQILFLLLDNAVKFTPQGSIEIAVRVDDGQLCCEIRDTGIGICPDDQQFIFDEFYQVDEPSSNKYRGSGLGLTLVRDLLGLLDGDISVSSDVGHGSSFRFRVPVQLLA